MRPRSWRRPPQQPISQMKEPKCLRKWEFWDSPCHSEWPKVADAVIKAQDDIRWEMGPFETDRHRRAPLCVTACNRKARDCNYRFLGPNYLHLSHPPGRDYLQLRLQSSGSDCNQRGWDHIICDYAPSCLSLRERPEGAPVSYACGPGDGSVSPHLKPPY